MRCWYRCQCGEELELTQAAGASCACGRRYRLAGEHVEELRAAAGLGARLGAAWRTLIGR